MCWERNDLARLDEGGKPADIHGIDVAAPASSGPGLPPAARRMLDAIERLPDGERETPDLVRIHGMTQVEAAELLGISVKTLLALLRNLMKSHPAGVRAFLEATLGNRTGESDLAALRDPRACHELVLSEPQEFQNLCEEAKTLIAGMAKSFLPRLRRNPSGSWVEIGG